MRCVIATRPTKAQLKRDLVAVFRRHRNRGVRVEEELRAERDRVIRGALEGGVGQEEIAALSKEHGKALTQGRISQIKRGVRG